VSGVGVVLGVGVAHELDEGVDYVLGDVFLIVPAGGEGVAEGFVLEEDHLLVLALGVEIGGVGGGEELYLLFLVILIAAIECDFIFDQNKSIKQHYLVALLQLVLPSLARKVHKLDPPPIRDLRPHGHRTRSAQIEPSAVEIEF